MICVANLVPPIRSYYSLNESDFDYPEHGLPSLNEIATRVYGMEYVGQQTDDCLPRGISYFDLSEDPGSWEYRHYLSIFDEQYPMWKAAHDAGSTYDFEIYRQAPGMGAVLADLIRRDELPRGHYQIHVDW